MARSRFCWTLQKPFSVLLCEPSCPLWFWHLHFMNHEGHNGSQRTRENITQTADGTILPALSACWSGLLRLFPENNPVEHLGIVDCLIACFATARVQRGRSAVKIRFSTASAIMSWTD